MYVLGQINGPPWLFLGAFGNLVAVAAQLLPFCIAATPSSHLPLLLTPTPGYVLAGHIVHLHTAADKNKDLTVEIGAVDLLVALLMSEHEDLRHLSSMCLATITASVAPRRAVRKAELPLVANCISLLDPDSPVVAQENARYLPHAYPPQCCLLTPARDTHTQAHTVLSIIRF